MQFDLSQFPAWVFPLLIFSMAVFFVVAGIRRTVEFYLPAFTSRNQWKKVWVPSMPPVLGAVAAAVMHSYPFLHTLPTWGTRALYGCVAGGFSSFMYRVVKAAIQARFNINVPDGDSTPPEALPEEYHEEHPDKREENHPPHFEEPGTPKEQCK